MGISRISIKSCALCISMAIVSLGGLDCPATSGIPNLKPGSDVEILDKTFQFVEVLPPDSGYSRIRLNNARIEEEGLAPTLVSGDKDIKLRPIFSRRTQGMIMSLSEPPRSGDWQLDSNYSGL